MHSLYLSGMTRNEIGPIYGVKGCGVYSAFRRFGFPVRSPKDAAPLNSGKRAGDNHWTKKNPLPIKSWSYRSQKIRDEDGKIHKRRVHVIAIEKQIGRRLLPTECVHHINGNKHDNRIENLQLMTRSQHGEHEIARAVAEHPENFQKDERGRFIGRGHGKQIYKFRKGRISYDTGFVMVEAVK